MVLRHTEFSLAPHEILKRVQDDAIGVSDDAIGVSDDAIGVSDDAIGVQGKGLN